MEYNKEKICGECLNTIKEAVEKSHIKKGGIFVVGCSTSEILGNRLGTNSAPEIGEAVFETINNYLAQNGIFLAAQCCEHLNRAIIIESEAAKCLERVNVVPQPKAGGSFATAAYKGFKNPVAVEFIKADAGIDIGCTLIGMHIKHVAVPMRLNNNKIGEAIVSAARTRPKFIGGERAIYDKNNM